MADALPIIEPLSAEIDSVQAFRRLAALPGCIFFDSALRDSLLGRYSFVAADPFDWYCSSPSDSSPLDRLGDFTREFSTPTIPELPPFQGGAAGLFGYALGRCWERLPAPRFDEFRLPELMLGFYDIVVAFDHYRGQAWLISQGFPERDSRRRRERALARKQEFLAILTREEVSRQPPRTSDQLLLEELVPQFEVPGIPGLTSNFSESRYLEMIERAVEYIRAGDIFQVNLAQRLLFPAVDSTPELYCRLRTRNPAPFAGYFAAGSFQIASASPERFLRLTGRDVETRPIKGTRRRLPNTETDLFLGDELQESDKDRAENVMIVDLLRNDLSRVCEPDSVRVSQLCGLEVYAHVQHLVSVVQGRLAPGMTAFDLLRCSFPGGSITGAPKIRAMEIIAELEPTARGPYCGSLGYLGFDGAMDLSILIRTVTAARGWWQFPVGGGIVAQSSPEREYAETWHKASGILRALRP